VDELRLWLRLLLGHRQTRPCPGGDHLCHCLVSAAEPVAGRRSARHIVHNIRSGGRLHHWLTLAVVVVLYTHTLAPHAPDAPRILSWAWPRHCHLSTLCAWTWGPQLQLRLQLALWHGRREAACPLVVALFAVVRQRGSYGLHHPLTRNYAM
jgi:hypothetical protein